MISYNISNWYWVIGGDQANVWSSTRAALVPVDDTDYVAWLTTNQPSQIGSMDELEGVFAEQYPPGSLRTYCIYTRWRLESGGMTLMSGMRIKTDDRSKARITNALDAVTANSQFKTMWHAADNTVRELDRGKIQAMSNELNAFVDNAFTISADVLSKIEAGTITTREQVDSAFGIAPAHYTQRARWDV